MPTANNTIAAVLSRLTRYHPVPTRQMSNRRPISRNPALPAVMARTVRAASAGPNVPRIRSPGLGSPTRAIGSQKAHEMPKVSTKKAGKSSWLKVE
jgi:hypothetical protein